MIKAVFDSFCRALIRFFDNRFIAKDPDDFYEMEIARLHKLIGNLIQPAAQTVIDTTDNEEHVAMPPIETTFQKRARLEKESLAKWNESVAEAKAKIAETLAQKKSTEELEQSVGII